jgi:hypothetical protein
VRLGVPTYVGTKRRRQLRVAFALSEQGAAKTSGISKKQGLARPQSTQRARLQAERRRGSPQRCCRRTRGFARASRKARCSKEGQLAVHNKLCRFGWQIAQRNSLSEAGDAPVVLQVIQQRANSGLISTDILLALLGSLGRLFRWSRPRHGYELGYGGQPSTGKVGS